MADVGDQAADPVATTPGDTTRDGPLIGTNDVGDTPPRKKRGRPPGAKNKTAVPANDPSFTAAQTAASTAFKQTEAKELKRLRKQLTGVLTGPAIVFQGVGEDWPAEHVEAQAPELANAIVDLAERDPAFKRRLQKFLEGGSTAGLVMAGLMYVGPLAIYFGAPAPPKVKEMLNIPPRGKRPGFMAEHAPAMEDISADELQHEALEHGFEDVRAYQQAVKAAVEGAVSSVHGPIADAPRAKP
jgi:hypothetical protein